MMMFLEMMKKMSMRMPPELYSRKAGWWGLTLVAGGPWLLKLKVPFALAGILTQNLEC